MDLKQVEVYCQSLPHVTEDYPFGPDVKVFRVGEKMFALIGSMDGSTGINLKCDPKEALALRDIFKSVKPGYHMSKAHWNTVEFNGDVPKGELERMIDNSYNLVYNSLPKSKKNLLEKK